LLSEDLIYLIVEIIKIIKKTAINISFLANLEKYAIEGEKISIKEIRRVLKRPISFLNKNGKKTTNKPKNAKGNLKVKLESPNNQKKEERKLKRNIPCVRGL
tara:strand:+ start:238 stop:543 length:306 start_codon:yes stop_codon:yes gene_type:complete